MSPATRPTFRKGLFAAMATVLAASLLFPALTNSSAEAQPVEGPSLMLTTPSTVEAGDVVTVELDAQLGFESLLTANVRVSWDPAQFDYADCAANGFVGVCSSERDTTGSARFGVAANEVWTEAVSIGSLELTALVDGAAEISAEMVEAHATTGGQPYTVDFADGVAELLIGALGTGSLTGQLSGAALSLVGLDVCAISVADAESVCTTSDADGAYLLEDLAAGDYLITIADPAGALAAVEGDLVTINADKLRIHDADLRATAEQVGLDELLESRPTLSEDSGAGTLAGTVFGPDGDAVFGVSVCATEMVELVTTCEYSGLNGEFSIGDLADGVYEITTEDPARRYGAAEAQLVNVGNANSLLELTVTDR